MLYNFDKAVTKMNKLKEMRLAANMKQSDLVALMNCSPQSISNYELGLRDLDSSSICKLCEIFGCTADYLLGRSSLPTAEQSEEESRRRRFSGPRGPEFKSPHSDHIKNVEAARLTAFLLF